MKFDLMRCLGISLFLFLMQFMLVAQIPIEVLSDTVFAKGTNVDVEVIGYNKIVNLSDDTLSVQWERVEASFVPGWESSFCDAYSCFPTNVNSGAFEFYPKDTSRMDLHLYSLGKVGTGYAFVTIGLESSGLVLDTLHYFFEVTTYSSIDENVSENEMIVCPIPARDYFILKNGSSFEHVEVLDWQGKVLKSFREGYGNRYEIQDLASGFYWIRIRQKNKLKLVYKQLIKM